MVHTVSADRDLQAELAAAKEQLAAAKVAAAALSGEEEAALSSDEAYSSLERRKKLAQREIERCQVSVTAAKIAVDDELARRELEAAERDYADVKEDNLRLREDLTAFRKRDVPRILRLLAALARDEIDCERVNRFVAVGRKIQPADRAMRSEPAINRETVAEEIVERWTIKNGQILTDQNAVQFDGKGQPFLQAGGNKYWAAKKLFRRIEETYFSPARDASPLWRMFEVPPMSLSEAWIYQGKQAKSPAHALQLIKAAENEAAKDYVVIPHTRVRLEPLDANGNSIVAPAASAEPPEVRERTELD